ncbi:MAG: T9SS type A sorting domain-containing protein [Bacteroidetes bacterium]|nr:T9SS type A sorting domain-containing protein [Bacteroidota bacterium]
MKKAYNLLFKKVLLFAGSMAILSTSAKALTYTAVASGNFNSTTTWGGVAPSGNITADVVIIPSGITVTLNTDETFSGLGTLTVNGTLTSGANNTALVMTGGTLTGSGSIDVDSMSLGLVSGFTYTGSIMAQNLTSTATTIGTAADITVSGNLYLNSGLLNINSGMLTLAANSNINITGGTLSVGGTGMLMLDSTYNVTYSGNASVNGGLELSGSGLNNLTVNLSSGSLTLTSDLTMNGNLTLTSGNLILNNNDLTLGLNGNFSASGTGTINAGANSNITINSMTGLSGALRFGVGNNTVNDLNINLGNTSANVSLGGDLTINGTLTLNQGTLTLNNNDLTFAVNGNIAASGSGSIVSTAGSNITITSNNSFTGGLNFSATGNTVGNLTVNMGNNTSTVNLGSNLTVNGTLTLTSGMLNVGTHNLSVAASGNVSGGLSTSYVVTSNGGTLTMNLLANGSQTFQVGTMMHYAPITVSANTGSANGDLSVMVDDSVYANGNTGLNLTNTSSLVNATWFLSSTASTGLDLKLQPMWSANMELNAFNRTSAHIAHYTNNAWDVSANASATTAVNGMYTISRDHVTSLSPFAVADQASGLSVNQLASSNKVDISMYPNPATDVVYFSAPSKASSITVYDVSGRMVKSVSANADNSIPVNELTPGNYSVQIKGQDYSSTQHFVKQ